MFACDNCTPGQAGHWKVVLIAIVLVAAFALLAQVLRALRRGWTVASRVAAVALLLAVLGAGSAVVPVSGDGAYCGSAVAASRERGVGLDRAQLACRRNGETFVHAGQLLLAA